MEEELRKKIAVRGYNKGILTRLSSYANSDLTKVTLSDIVAKKERLMNVFRDYENTCKEILYLNPNDGENVAEVEDVYFNILTSLTQEIDKRETLDSTHVIASKPPLPTSSTKFRLPEISLQIFDGKFADYVPFISIFNSMIHKDINLDNVQKLYYLRSSLQGEPFDLIKNLPLVPDSYNKSLKLLKDRYDNKYKIVNEYIYNLLDLKCIIKPSASNLRDFVASVRQLIAAIGNHDQSVNKWDAILLCILCRKLDNYTARAYQLDRDPEAEPCITNFLKYLERRALALENSGQTNTLHLGKVAAHAANATSGPRCLNCKSDHKLFKCKGFQSMTASQRVTFIKNNKLCTICLGAHKGKCRFHFRCAECKESHNTLLHCKDTVPAPPVTLIGNVENNVLLPTARVKVFGKDGTEYHIKALMDSGSQASLVTTKLIQILGLTPNQRESSINIIGISNARSTTKYCIPLEVHSIKYPFKAKVNCHVVQQITCKLPQVKFDISNLKIPHDILLADDDFNIPGDIHMLIGADVFFQTLLPTQRVATVHELDEETRSPNNPVICNTLFGHIIGGALPTNLSSKSCNKVVLKTQLYTTIHDTISNFWSNEKVPEVFNEETSEEKLCEQIFQSTVKLENCKFEVVLPLKLPLSEVNDTLGESFQFALKRFLNLEKKLHSNFELFNQYQSFIHEYLKLNHAHVVDIESYDFNKQPVYFLPHHAVINEKSKTTSLRTVFDGSMKTNKKISLNDLQLNGPIVQRNIFDIILLFRLGKYTFTTDLKHMFRNIRLNPEYTSLQNILWRDHPSQSIKCIRLDTVTYGLKSSSYLATRCLEELSNRFKDSHPVASFILRNFTYVDDVLYSDNVVKDILNAKQQLCDLLRKGSFHTHKWSSNCDEVLYNIPYSDQNCDTITLQREDDNHINALGLKINVKNDKFVISAPDPFNSKILTKRDILSYIGKFYDPMGFISPIVVKAKVIMQKLWLQNIGWNNFPPLDIQKEWLKFTADLAAMKVIYLNRHIDILGIKTAELIGFADASNTAYGCCVYLRITKNSGITNLHLLCSKSRINPINKKGMTMPRLELNAALLLSKLIVKTYNTLELRLNITNVLLFSDSQIVLAWLKTEVTKLQAYIANRVNAINQTTCNWSWLYVNTKDNPADLVSRGVSPDELQSSELWWHGPQFLQNSEYKEPSYSTQVNDLPDLKPCTILASCTVYKNYNVLDFVFERLYNHSNIRKIVRLLAYILRFLNNVNKNNQKRHSSYLTSTELEHSLILIVRHEQGKHFSSEIDNLRKRNGVKGNLANLHPFVDELGVLRVGGRLHHANISYAQRHPMILPKSSHITSMIIRNEHERLLHAGPRLLLYSLNQKFWIVNGLLEIKRITHKCIICFRQKATVAKQLMGSLPASRVTATSRPFEKIGVDFAGPIEVKLSRVRRSVIGKGYICVFVCFTTKAIHLELASDLTTDNFLGCLRRLVSRRGLPTEIHCDNASTFKCARTQLVELYSLMLTKDHQKKVQKFAAENGISFHFIPSYSPTFGGLWEAAVKSTKYHLKRTLQKAVLTYEQLNTVLIEIEGILNSRPLIPLSSDPNDYCYLTPGHFIIGSALNMYPERNTLDVPQNKLKFWELCTNIKQSFWKTWHKYYLNVLQSRPKWLTDKCDVKIGSLVILKEDNLPCMLWPMARITKLFPGHDGRIRVVEVIKPNQKTHIRSIHKICLLPIDYD